MSRFHVAIAAAAIAASPAAAATTSDRTLGTFHSPSGQVRCTLNAQRVICTTMSSPRTAVRIMSGGKAARRPALAITAGSVLPYGQTTTIARFSCASSSSGVRCRDRKTGHAFVISRIGVKLQPAPRKVATPAKPKPRSSGTDPRLRSCAAVRSAGLGPYRRGIDPEYSWYRDADGDGIVCESQG